jgi:hypothetical protein
MVYGIPSNSLGMRRYEFFRPTTQPKIEVGSTSLYRFESGDKITINTG